MSFSFFNDETTVVMRFCKDVGVVVVVSDSMVVCVLGIGGNRNDEYRERWSLVQARQYLTNAIFSNIHTYIRIHTHTHTLSMCHARAG